MLKDVFYWKILKYLILRKSRYYLCINHVNFSIGTWGLFEGTISHEEVPLCSGLSLQRVQLPKKDTLMEPFEPT